MLAAALAVGKTWAAAQTVGVSRATVARRMREPAFWALVSEPRRSAVDEALGRFTAALADAVSPVHPPSCTRSRRRGLKWMAGIRRREPFFGELIFRQICDGWTFVFRLVRMTAYRSTRTSWLTCVPLAGTFAVAGRLT